jgi:hypothetical protein
VKKIIKYQYISFRQWDSPLGSKVRTCVALGAAVHLMVFNLSDRLLSEIKNVDLSCLFKENLSLIWVANWLICSGIIWGAGSECFSEEKMSSEDFQKARWWRLALITMAAPSFFWTKKINCH